MKIGIVGGGITGLTASYDLLNAGYEVTIFEASENLGGLASGFSDESWEWPLEKFYHHLFATDKEIIRLVQEIGMEEKLFFPRPITSVIYQDKIVPFDSPKAWITFPGFNLIDVARFGFVSAYLRFTRPWRNLEQFTADEWMRRWYGQKVYETVWRPLLIGKFGPYYQEANMAWMWARLHVRTPKLGYFKGGFQAFVDKLTDVVRKGGGKILTNHPVKKVRSLDDGRFEIVTAGQAESFDRALVTTSPALFSKIAPSLPSDYLGQLLKLKSMGAVVMTLALKHSLMKDSQTYWLNIPARAPDKVENEIPFLALVEHTNYISRNHYGGDHIIYCGDYVTPDHRYFNMSHEQLEELFVSVLHKINPNFTQDWVRKSWLFRAKYAQPVPLVNQSANVPELRTPIANLYFASMSQVYPWDRGTNFAVEIGRQVAKLILQGKSEGNRLL